jgi:hypothetical protein
MPPGKHGKSPNFCVLAAISRLQYQYGLRRSLSVVAPRVLLLVFTSLSRFTFKLCCNELTSQFVTPQPSALNTPALGTCNCLYGSLSLSASCRILPLSQEAHTAERKDYCHIPPLTKHAQCISVSLAQEAQIALQLRRMWCCEIEVRSRTARVSALHQSRRNLCLWSIAEDGQTTT